MKNSEIYFKIININKEQKTIDINLKINNLYNTKELKLYRGNTKITNITYKNEIKEELQYIKLKNIKENLDINYTVKIGNLGKHGQNGLIEENIITFAGDQVFILPIDVLSANDEKLNELVGKIHIQYNELLNKEKIIIPYEQVLQNEKVSISIKPKWDNIYEIMKSCYTFGKLINIQNDNKKEYVKILIQNESKICNKNQKITKEINKLCDYYENLFDYKIQNLNIILLDKNENEYILGGAGRSIIGSTFDSNNIRDWQLLSHRLFHAYMDFSITISYMHKAPYLWITEGLATYYEHLALQSLDKNIKNKLNIDFNNEMKKIFKRYLYMKLKDINTLNIVPMQESKITSHGKIEFLHYTQAPLLIKLIEDITKTKFKKSNNLIKYLKETDEIKFNVKEMFDYVLKEECDVFAMKFLFSDELIPLFTLGSCNNEDENDIINELNEFEYLMWSWFAKEDSNYILDNISVTNLEKIANIAHMNNIKFSSSLIEEQIKSFSITIYNLLKQYVLRATICNVNKNNPNIRYLLLGNINNIIKWENYIKRF